jgi:hypothetical protein
MINENISQNNCFFITWMIGVIPEWQYVRTVFKIQNWSYGDVSE